MSYKTLLCPSKLSHAFPSTQHVMQEHPCAPHHMMPAYELSWNESNGSVTIALKEPLPKTLTASFHLFHPDWSPDCSVAGYDREHITIPIADLATCVAKDGQDYLTNFEFREYNTDPGCGSTSVPIQIFKRCFKVHEITSATLWSDVFDMNRPKISCPNCDEGVNVSTTSVLVTEMPLFLGEDVFITAEKIVPDSPAQLSLIKIEWWPVYTGQAEVLLRPAVVLDDGAMLPGATMLSRTSVVFKAMDLGYTRYYARAVVNVDHGLGRRNVEPNRTEIWTSESFDLARKIWSSYKLTFINNLDSSRAVPDRLQTQAALVQSTSTAVRYKDVVIQWAEPDNIHRRADTAVTASVIVTSKYPNPVDMSKVNATLAAFGQPNAQLLFISAASFDGDVKFQQLLNPTPVPAHSLANGTGFATVTMILVCVLGCILLLGVVALVTRKRASASKRPLVQ
eukprot:1237721-Rhodomonas_salina.1